MSEDDDGEESTFIIEGDGEEDQANVSGYQFWVRFKKTLFSDQFLSYDFIFVWLNYKRLSYKFIFFSKIWPRSFWKLYKILTY